MIQDEKTYKSVCNNLKQLCKDSGYSILGESLSAANENYMLEAEMIDAVTQNLANEGYVKNYNGYLFRLTNKGYDFFLNYDENKIYQNQKPF